MVNRDLGTSSAVTIQTMPGIFSAALLLTFLTMALHGAPQHLYDEAVFGHDVFRIDRLPRNQGLGILLATTLLIDLNSIMTGPPSPWP